MVHSAGIKGSDWAVCVAGFRGASISDVDNLLERVQDTVSPYLFQLFDAEMVAGWGHLYHAAVNAVKAHQTGQAVSKSLPVEVLLYASCQDQISRAFETMGISPETDRVALIVLAKSVEAAETACEAVTGLLGIRDDSVLDMSDEKFEQLKDAFQVSSRALESVGGQRKEVLSQLIIERGSLLSTRR